MKVLLSIKPKYVEKIFAGIKKYEYRKKIFKNTDVNTIVIYSSNPIKKIVGEFKIKKIIKDSPQKLWELAPKNTGIDRITFDKYFHLKKEGYAIEIGEIKIYKTPKSLDNLGLKKPPQSFLYLKN